MGFVLEPEEVQKLIKKDPVTEMYSFHISMVKI